MRHSFLLSLCAWTITLGLFNSTSVFAIPVWSDSEIETLEDAVAEGSLGSDHVYVPTPIAAFQKKVSANPKLTSKEKQTELAKIQAWIDGLDNYHQSLNKLISKIRADQKYLNDLDSECHWFPCFDCDGRAENAYDAKHELKGHTESATLIWNRRALLQSAGNAWVEGNPLPEIFPQDPDEKEKLENLVFEYGVRPYDALNEESSHIIGDSW